MGAEEKINILLVDDKPENLLALEAVLAAPSYNIVKALTGREALKCILAQDFALILLDVQMPVMDGFEIARLIKQRERSRYIPIIFITAVSKDTMHISEGYSSGAVDYILKPVDPYVLKSKVSFFVELHKKNLQLRQLNEDLRGTGRALEDANASLRSMHETCERQVIERTAQIQKLNAELERRIAERSAELKLAYNEMESFSHSVSHDLRAPLRHINHFSRFVLNKHSQSMDEEGKDYLRRIIAAGQEMEGLIEALLTLSRVTRGEMQREPVDLGRIARSVAQDLSNRDPDRRVEFSIADAPEAEGDEQLLRLVMANLLDNAWKFTSKREEARIEFGSTQGPEGCTVFFVRDNGVGFDVTHASKLFNVFERLHPTAEFPGTGVGLATVQRIIERHGGAIWGEGEVGKGATFYFVLP
jgi:signal transduction histidine kinase